MPSGTQINYDLQWLLPELRTHVFCPAFVRSDCEPLGESIIDMIMHLNDDHRWTREQIADWLETLDVDLSFPTESTPPPPFSPRYSRPSDAVASLNYGMSSLGKSVTMAAEKAGLAFVSSLTAVQKKWLETALTSCSTVTYSTGDLHFLCHRHPPLAPDVDPDEIVTDLLSKKKSMTYPKPKEKKDGRNRTGH